MLQARLFSYADTHRHRLGPNYLQIPINTAFKARVRNQQRDGPMCVDGNQGDAPNYHPNSFGWVYYRFWHKHAAVCPHLALPLPLSHTCRTCFLPALLPPLLTLLWSLGCASMASLLATMPTSPTPTTTLSKQVLVCPVCVCVDGQDVFRHVYSVLLCYTLVVDQATCSAP